MGVKAPGTAGRFIWQSGKTQNSTTYYYNHSGAREQEEFLLEYKFLHLLMPKGKIAKLFNDAPQLSAYCLTGENCCKT
jgi:hypothetical protein